MFKHATYKDSIHVNIKLQSMNEIKDQYCLLWMFVLLKVKIFRKSPSN